ncbi:NADP-dependent oxidoreductase [Microbacterium sp. zg.Y1090]|uniref:NADP-dependent oxidoreductase n=1 Tax=Microbacterium TaxID=33882 RepID=UPI00214BA32D|nr:MULTISPECIES: NADP-dependent oxidoreductase [unclassified Microbacterium]MCR2811782.1 NADP-dependent oxidoreductase [Microbacterium sp. zg.Y1084]MCR2818780.1 NADP-dependent oxidoreductase [Microbacterium sp. zg.Y1090]MDL5486870.1 NADP-dependent oxidoreductase [Microbacterium sp. zg-Y1211]WIM27097.1 NADP-dependent oxidoreductase [Microbacterium sp. zg-Y1090]
MARRWEAPRWGGPEGWELADVEVPAPLHGEVTIKMAAAGMNPADVKHVAVERPGLSLPVPIGYEVSGVLTAIGPGTQIASGTAAVGDEVLAFRVTGGYGTELTVPADKVFAKPASLTHPEAANLLLAGTTASELLHVTGASPGETVLLHGGSGAVGVAVLQLARRLGVRVIATASPGSFERVRRYGGVPVAYGEGLLDRVRDAANHAPVVAALDAAGTDEALQVSLEVVADPSRVVTIAATDAAERLGIRRIGGGMPASAAYRDGVRAELIALAGAGELEVPIAGVFPLERLHDALQVLLSGHPGGKLALVP